jgi:hypothetical protein
MRLSSRIKEIIDYRRDGHALLKDNGFLITSTGQWRLKRTTLLARCYREGDEECDAHIRVLGY